MFQASAVPKLRASFLLGVALLRVVVTYSRYLQPLLTAVTFSRYLQPLPPNILVCLQEINTSFFFNASPPKTGPLFCTERLPYRRLT